MNSISENPYQSPTESRSSSRSSLPGYIAAAVMVLSGTAFVFLVLFIGPFAWLLRDGLGPDSTDSVGWNAITRLFWCFYWGPMTIFVALAFSSALATRRKLLD